MNIQNEKEASKLPGTSSIGTGKDADLSKDANGITKGTSVKTPPPPVPPSSPPTFPTQGTVGTPETSNQKYEDGYQDF